MTLNRESAEEVKEQISTGLLKWITPILIVIVGYLLNRQITQIDDSVQSVSKKVEKIETGNQINMQLNIELRTEVRELQRRVNKLEH